MKKQSIAIIFLFIAIISILDFLAAKNLLTGTRSNYVWFILMIPVLYYSFKLCNDFHFESSYFKLIFYIFISYNLIVFLRGFSNTKDFLSIVRSGPILWALFIPFFVFLDKSLLRFNHVFNLFYALGICFMVLNIIFPSLLLNRLTAETIIPSLAIGCSFLFLNSKYISNRKAIVSFIVLLLSALSYTYLARRSAAFTFYAFLFVGSLFNMWNKSQKLIFKILPFLVIGGSFIFLIPNRFSDKLLHKMDERLLEDTRTALFDEFYAQMRDDQLFGKGMNGTYYYPMAESIQDDGIVYSAVTYRNIIENGYLQLYLTGGILHIILFVLVLLPASIVGIFYSSNTFTRACGVMIFLWLIDMFLYGMPTLSIHYILVWICAGFCFKKSIRLKSDIEIYNELHPDFIQTYNSNIPDNYYSNKRIIKENL